MIYSGGTHIECLFFAFSTFIKIALSFLSLIPPSIPPTDDRETTDRRVKRYRALAAKNSDSTPCFPKSTFIKIGFLKNLPHFLKRLTNNCVLRAHF